MLQVQVSFSRLSPLQSSLPVSRFFTTHPERLGGTLPTKVTIVCVGEKVTQEPNCHFYLISIHSSLQWTHPLTSHRRTSQVADVKKDVLVAIWLALLWITYSVLGLFFFFCGFFWSIFKRSLYSIDIILMCHITDKYCLLIYCFSYNLCVLCFFLHNMFLYNQIQVPCLGYKALPTPLLIGKYKAVSPPLLFFKTYIFDPSGIYFYILHEIRVQLDFYLDG